VLKRDKGTEDTDSEAKIQQLQNKIDQHDKNYSMKSFNTEETDCAELRACAYEVKQEVIVDDDGGAWEPLTRVL
jgi:hypothetical protein